MAAARFQERGRRIGWNVNDYVKVEMAALHTKDDRGGMLNNCAVDQTIPRTVRKPNCKSVCQSLHHQAGRETFTPRMSDMHGTPPKKNPPAAGNPFGERQP